MKRLPRVIIDAVKTLIDEYKQLDLKAIQKAWRLVSVRLDRAIDGGDVMKDLTGFSQSKGCALCSVVDELYPDFPDNCDCCFYCHVTDDECTEGVNKSTYDLIDNAESPKELFFGVRTRMQHLENLLEKYEDEVE